jgi:hypothetical protein
MNPVIDHTTPAKWPFSFMPVTVNWIRRALPLLLVFAIAVIVRRLVVANTDVSWLITVVEKMLDGQRLYVDVIELNPPASVFLYLPPVMLARFLGLAPELVVDLLVFAAICASLLLAGRILLKARMLDGFDGWAVAAFAAAILAVLPAQVFGQREHIAVISLLPVLAVYSVRARRACPDLAFAIVAGLGAGITMTIKPHFVLVNGLALLASMLVVKSWRPFLAIENWIAGAIVLFYVASIFTFYPEFIDDIAPLAAAVYVPYRLSFLGILTHPATMLWGLIFLAFAGLKRGAPRDSRYAVLLAASGGFVLVFMIQGKGWPYHAYPMLALVLMALTFNFTEIEQTDTARDRRPRARPIGSPFTIAGLLGVSFLLMNLALNRSALVEPIRRIKPHPTLLAISTDIGVGHPLVRQVGGTWVGTVGSLWIAMGAHWLLANRQNDPAMAARLAAYAARGRAMLIEDIRRGQPEVLVISTNTVEWLHEDPVLAGLLSNYVRMNTLDDVIILRRSDIGRPAEIAGQH